MVYADIIGDLAICHRYPGYRQNRSGTSSLIFEEFNFVRESIKFTTGDILSMHYIILFVAIGLLGFYSTGHSAEISAEQLSRINGLAIVDNEGEQYIAATDQGLYHSDDHGRSWKAYAG